MVQLGCGITGLVCAEELAKNPKVSEIVLADSRTEAAERLASRLKNEKVSVKKVDGSDKKSVRSVLKGKDLVVCSLPYRLLRGAFETAADVGVNYLDFSLTVDKVEDIPWQMKKCKDAGITTISAMGADPGISDAMAVRAASKLDEPKEAHVYDGDCGVAEGHEVFSLWSPVDMLEEATVPAAICRNGEFKFVPPLHEREEYDFPAPIGRLPVYKTLHEETFLMAKYIPGITETDFRIGIDDNFVSVAKAIRKLGMHSLTPVDYGGCKVVPLNFVSSFLPRTVDLPGKVKGHAGLVIEVIGKKNGKKMVSKVWGAMSHEYAYNRWKSNATGALVGIGGALGADILLSGHIKGPGLFVPEQLPVDKILEKLPSMGMEIKEEVKAL